MTDERGAFGLPNPPPSPEVQEHLWTLFQHGICHTAGDLQKDLWKVLGDNPDRWIGFASLALTAQGYLDQLEEQDSSTPHSDRLALGMLLEHLVVHTYVNPSTHEAFEAAADYLAHLMTGDQDATE